MPVWVIEANHPLSPRMFLDRVNILDITLSELIRKFIEIIFFKIEFKIIAAQPSIMSVKPPRR